MVPLPGACTIEHYGFVIYGKMTDFVVYFLLVVISTLAWANTLAYY
jgi:hypothetical protein